MTILSAAILLSLVMDPFGNVPVFIVVLKDLPDDKRQDIVIRELLISLAVLLLFLFFGPHILNLLHISEPSMRIAGGIILFLIAIKMVFGQPESMFHGAYGEEPLIVPLAIPCIAGPSSIATVMLLTGQAPERLGEWIISLVLAWLATSLILLLSIKLDRVLGRRGLGALQHLMGLILTALAVEMFLQGIRSVFALN